ncbi:hypothetical protein J4Q44_G00128700 [Coregonus suidteri]|uniref:Uncharacterized protein n=1 Tax=Coregonus suidteri TaxID=861788 RepID=A0AAN8M301_9TELE
MFSAVKRNQVRRFLFYHKPPLADSHTDTVHHKRRSDQVNVRQTETITAHLCASPGLGGSTLLLSVIGVSVAFSFTVIFLLSPVYACVSILSLGECSLCWGYELTDPLAGWPALGLGPYTVVVWHLRFVLEAPFQTDLNRPALSLFAVAARML